MGVGAITPARFVRDDLTRLMRSPVNQVKRPFRVGGLPEAYQVAIPKSLVRRYGLESLGAFGDSPCLASGLGGCSWDPRDWVDCSRDGAKWVARKAKEAYNWTAKKVKDFDGWMRRKVPGYSFVSDIVIEYGAETFAFFGKTINGAIEVLIVTAGYLVAGIVAGAICGAGTSVGLPIPPHVCTAIGIAVGGFVSASLSSIYDDFKKEFREHGEEIEDENANAFAMGLYEGQCGIPDHETALGNEPNPNLSPCTQTQMWAEYARIESQSNPPLNLAYYRCRQSIAEEQCRIENTNAQPAVKAAVETDLMAGKPRSVSEMNRVLHNPFTKDDRSKYAQYRQVQVARAQMAKKAAANRIESELSAAKKRADDETITWMIAGSVILVATLARKKGLI